MTLIETAKMLSTCAHAGQCRRDGSPYIAHPAAVADKLKGEPEEVIAAAWLHDVLEDTTETLDLLREGGIPESVIEAVEVLTKRKGVSYEDYLLGVKHNPIALKVKVADMIHNLSDDPTASQIVKYAKGLLFLKGSCSPPLKQPYVRKSYKATTVVDLESHASGLAILVKPTGIGNHWSCLCGKDGKPVFYPTLEERDDTLRALRSQDRRLSKNPTAL